MSKTIVEFEVTGKDEQDLRTSAVAVLNEFTDNRKVPGALGSYRPYVFSIRASVALVTDGAVVKLWRGDVTAEVDA